MCGWGPAGTPPWYGQPPWYGPILTADEARPLTNARKADEARPLTSVPPAPPCGPVGLGFVRMSKEKSLNFPWNFKTSPQPLTSVPPRPPIVGLWDWWLVRSHSRNHRIRRGHRPTGV